MTAFGEGLTQAFTLLLKPFENSYAYAGIIFISLLTGAIMLFLFRLTSNQEAMKEVKAKIGAYFLEMRLYKEDISTVMTSQSRILRANLGYMKLALIPALVMIVPVILIMIQLDLRYSHDSLRPGDEAIIKVKLEEGLDVIREQINLAAKRGIEKASPAVRISSLREVDWKIRLTEPGTHTINLTTRAGQLALPVFGTTRLVPIYTSFKKGSFWEVLLNPGAPSIPVSMPIESVEIQYQSMSFDWGLMEISWLWTFLIISFAFGLILKFVLKVE